MRTYSFTDIVEILQVKPLQQHGDPRIDTLLTDSRKLLFPDSTLFFAISTPQKDANTFIPGLYNKGVRCFITDKAFSDAELSALSEACVIYSEDVLAALQKIVADHRHHFNYPVIGITGSNGKTIVKEWLFHLLANHYQIVHSPKSYNSQVGVPLSVWQMNAAHNLGIFEAGISQAGEMQRLQPIIDPQIGVITYIGEAHAKGFDSKDEKINEKLSLFINSEALIYNADDIELNAAVLKFKQKKNPQLQLFTCSYRQGDVTVKKVIRGAIRTNIDVTFRGSDYNFSIPFTDDASVSNAITSCAVLCYLGISMKEVSSDMESLRAVEMRMELKDGINDCSIINDSYSADISSLAIALDFLEQQKQHAKKTIILSDFLESGLDKEVLYRRIAETLSKKNLYRLIGIGPRICEFANKFDFIANSSFFADTDAFLDALPSLHFSEETILLKGARKFRFEKIGQALQQKMHETVLEINLHALRHNLKTYKKMLDPATRMMAMVKAFSYGSGSFEIANLLQHAGADYLAVAYADEGVELRKAGISLPIMVMSPEEASFHQLLKYQLEPEIYSLNMLSSFRHFLAHQQIKAYPVHIKLDTGMHRLGFMPDEIDELCARLQCAPEIKTVSVFSHLAASDDPSFDDFTAKQAGIFEKMSGKIEKAIGHTFLRHLANSAGIHRHTRWQYDMVRLGIGLYGIDSDPLMQPLLHTVTNLKTTISQIKIVKAGDSVGYGRKAMVEKDKPIAIVQIGYADGYPRSLSNGVGKMLVNGMPAPIIGNICMDMTMLDITGIDAREGDQVIVFGESLPVNLIAEWAGTIPYEILTGVSQRVRRAYFEE